MWYKDRFVVAVLAGLFVVVFGGTIYLIDAGHNKDILELTSGLITSVLTVVNLIAIRHNTHKMTSGNSKDSNKDPP